MSLSPYSRLSPSTPSKLTFSRPSNSANALATRIMLISPRGLAPWRTYRRVEGVACACSGWVESTTRTLLTKPTAARKIVVKNGRVTYRDALVLDEDGAPLELELQNVEGHLTHHWLSGRAVRPDGARVHGDGYLEGADLRQGGAGSRR